MAEIRTADSSDGVKVLSSQDNPTPKGEQQGSVSSETPEGQKPVEQPTPAITSKPRSKKAAKESNPSEPERNSRGVPISQWDNAENDPNKRASIAEDPTGESNKLVGH